MAAAAEMSGLARLMRPRAVAIVGATPEPGTIGGAVLAAAGAVQLFFRKK